MAALSGARPFSLQPARDEQQREKQGVRVRVALPAEHLERSSRSDAWLLQRGDIDSSPNGLQDRTPARTAHPRAVPRRVRSRGFHRGPRQATMDAGSRAADPVREKESRMSRLRVVQWSTGGRRRDRGSGDRRTARPRARRRLGPRPGQTGARCGRAGRRPKARDPGDERCRRAPRAAPRLHLLHGERRVAAHASVSTISSACSRAGINVVTTSVPGPRPSRRLRSPRRSSASQAACRAGGASLYASGIEPGFAGDELVLRLATPDVIGSRASGPRRSSPTPTTPCPSRSSRSSASASRRRRAA